MSGVDVLVFVSIYTYMYYYYVHLLVFVLQRVLTIFIKQYYNSFCFKTYAI